MKKVELADPREAAHEEARRVRERRHELVEGRLERVFGEAPHLDRTSLLAGLTAFHRERMARVPAAATFPEAAPWVAHILAVDRELQRLAGLSDEQMAIYRSLTAFLTFRGFRAAHPIRAEKCRVAFFPETDQGAMHIKNVDDPATFWKPEPPLPATSEWTEQAARFLVWDGVGSGLHEDDEPSQIFPLPVPQMCLALCDEVPTAVEFLTRYSPFWGGQNIVLRDAQKRSVAIEKCSYNFIEVFEPDATGRSWCSGMACRDPNSPQGRYQARKRADYVTRFNLPTDGQDAAFWAACDKAERMLADFMRQPAMVRMDEVLRLFLTPYPDGLCKNGWRFHPDQAETEYTLITAASVSRPNRRTAYRWQRGPKPELTWPTAPEVSVAVRPDAGAERTCRGK